MNQLARPCLEKIKEAEYESVDDVILAGLSLMDQENKKVEALRAAIIAGENSGPSKSFDADAFKDKMCQKHSRLNA